jgi:hypothetical protein
VEGGGKGERGGDRSYYEPGAATNPEVSDWTPEEVNALGENEKRDDLGASSDVDSLLAEQIGENTGNDPVCEDGVRGDEKAEEPGAVIGYRRIQACGLLQGYFGHAFDVSMAITARSPD